MPISFATPYFEDTDGCIVSSPASSKHPDCNLKIQLPAKYGLWSLNAENFEMKRSWMVVSYMKASLGTPVQSRGWCILERSRGDIG